MSDLQALANSLSALAGKSGDVFDAGARVVSRGGTPEALAAILNAVDDVILERSLEIDVDGKKLHLVAAGRRLRGIAGADTDEGVPFFGEVLSREEPETVQSVGTFLKEMCSDANRVTIKSVPPVSFGSNGERGISATGLAELWNISLQTTPQPAMNRFLNAQASALTATMHVRDGEMISITGDYKTLQVIWNEQAASFRTAHDKLVRAETGQIVCLEDALENGDTVALALCDDDVALLSFKPDALGTVLRSWRAMTT